MSAALALTLISYWCMRRMVFVFLSCVILVVSRRPDVIFHAQFWAEDGKFWYADAYNLGIIHPLLQPSAGYFQTLPRLAAAIALILPLSTVPLMLNCIAILIQILPAQFLLSSRCRELGSFPARCLFAFLYLALPNSQEMHANITNAQWRLALLALLIVFSRPGRSMLWNAFDYGVLTLSVLTGPFVIFIAPIAAFYYRLEPKSRWRLTLLAISGIGAAIEALAVLITRSSRMIHEVRGATPQLLIQILAKQDFLATLVGRRVLAGFSFNSRSGLIVAILAAAAGIAIELYVLLKAPLPWKALILFSAGILGVSLAYPMTSSPQWPALLASGGVRYWFFPMLAFIASVVWMLNRQNSLLIRGTALVLLSVMSYGIVQDWGHPRPVDFRFADYSRKFSEQPAGTKFFIPINPVGWSMVLMKR
jgi:hypothetical protein